MNAREAIFGCLLGTAVGDALGLPCEGMTPQKQRRYFGEIVGHRLFFGRGLYSDDAEHTILVAQALISVGLVPRSLLRIHERKALFPRSTQCS